MICPHCHQEIQENVNGADCPHCQGRDPSFRSYGAPTLIRGVPAPAREPARRPSDRRGPLLWPMVWLGLSLITICFFWAAALGPDRVAGGMAEPEVAPGPAIRPAPPPAAQDTDRTRIVVQVPAGHWVDTGIDMCGCVHFTVDARGNWKTPLGIATDAAGVWGYSRERLARRQAYGSLIAKVGTDPYTGIGASKVLDGEDFNSDGTLKLGMNAHGHAPAGSAAGALVVTITGHFSQGRP